ncbi:MAG: peptide deformylase, partial [Dehalococcoidia bacterium]
MSILEIRIVPDPILKIKAHKIKKIDDSIKTLALDMFETLQDAHGV